ncbi:MAG: hypothetical protein ACRDGV_07745 [Candidatus Limnocylindria bacterium]
MEHELGTSWSGSTATATWRLVSGDARQALKELPGQSVDCVVTSPPYFWQRDYQVDGQISSELHVSERRSELAVEVVKELLDYWGMRLAPQAIEAQLNAARASIRED